MYEMNYKALFSTKSSAQIKKIALKSIFLKNYVYLCGINDFLIMAEAKIISVEQTEKTGLFTIIFENETETELQKFLTKFKDNAERNKDLQNILNALRRILDNGALERYFRYEGKMRDHTVALPVLRNKLRLYCLRLSDSVLIVGNGGEKDSQTYEESAELNGYVITLQKLDDLIREGVADGSIVIEANEIKMDDDKTFDL